MPVPAGRIRCLNAQPPRPTGAWVVYWVTAARRAQSNFALDRAIELAKAHDVALVVLEALRVGYRWANDRLHNFVLEGMADNARRFAKSAITYLPYVEPEPGAGSGLLEALTERAVTVVTDDWPCFFVPRMQAAFASAARVRVEAVDSNGLYPMHDTPRVFTTAHSFRTHLQKVLPQHLSGWPNEAPLRGLELRRAAVPPSLLRRWPMAAFDEPLAHLVARLPVDHAVPPVTTLRGGSTWALRRLDHFVTKTLPRYAESRNEPEVDGTSKLSASLHFGHLSVHEVLRAIAEQERWSIDRLGRSIGGAKAGWWQLSVGAEAYLDELITWRELAFNMASHRPESYASLTELPAWAVASHRRHASDPRPHRYSLDELDAASTHDPLWNAIQRQLMRDGWFHGYLRMLWGKKIFEWSPSPQAALDAMEHLMNRYSLDGRDPVSYSGFLWVLGRYDRAWGPVRPIFGTVRYMSSANTAKKISVKNYLESYR